MGHIGRSDWLIFGRDFTVRTITMETVRFCFFSRSLLGNSKSCETQRGKKWKFSSKSLSSKRLTDNIEYDEEYEHLPIEFYHPEERLDENSNETGVEASRTTESQEEIEGFLKEQKSVNTLTKTTTDMNTFSRNIKEIFLRVFKSPIKLTQEKATF